MMSSLRWVGAVGRYIIRNHHSTRVHICMHKYLKRFVLINFALIRRSEHSPHQHGVHQTERFRCVQDVDGHYSMLQL